MGLGERLRNEIVNDYYTPNLKAEVIFDTLLTPVIGEILTVMLHKYAIEKDTDGQEWTFKGDMRLITKEFPIFNIKREVEVGSKDKDSWKEYGETTKDNVKTRWMRQIVLQTKKRDGITPQTQNGDVKKWAFTNHNVDYLMYDDNCVYLVELKTDLGSLDAKQRARYEDDRLRLCGEAFCDTLGREFISLMRHVYRSELKKLELKNPELKDLGLPENLTDKNTLEKLCVSLMKNSSGFQNEASYAENAKLYLKEHEKSSKKYLFTAGQMLGCREEWWGKKIGKIIYIMPERASMDRIPDSVVISIEEILSHQEEIRKKIESADKDKALYWDKLVKVLEACF